MREILHRIEFPNALTGVSRQSHQSTPQAAVSGELDDTHIDASIPFRCPFAALGGRPPEESSTGAPQPPCRSRTGSRLKGSA